MGLLDRKVAIVTGAGAGIGRQYALALAREGAFVVVNDLGCSREGEGSSHEPAEKVVAEIKALGGQAVANFDSVNTVEGGRKIFETAMNAFGRVDILINNAGIRRDKSFGKMTEDMWDDVILTNLKGVFCVTKPVFEHMKERGGPGRIINISSVAGLYGNFGQANYAAAKAGVVGFTYALAIEGRKYGITVNCLLPYARTRLTETLPPFQTEEAKVELNPEFIPPLAVWLCTNEAQDITGKLFFVLGNTIYMLFVEREFIATKPAQEGPWRIGELGKIVKEYHKDFTKRKLIELPFPSRIKK